MIEPSQFLNNQFLVAEVKRGMFPFDRRLLLRPHGRSAGRVRRISILSYKGKLGGWFIWDSKEMVYRTRAQAAQAVWEAHKQADVKLRAMMPSVRYEWEERSL